MAVNIQNGWVRVRMEMALLQKAELSMIQKLHEFAAVKLHCYLLLPSLEFLYFGDGSSALCVVVYNTIPDLHVGHCAGL